MYKLFMAFRYLRAHKSVYFSIAGVAFGLLAMVVVTSIMGGFSRDMRTRIRGMQTDIVVTSYDKNLWIREYEELGRAIEAVPHVTGTAPRIEYAVWMGRNGVRRYVQLVGIVPARERKVSQIEKYFRQGGKTRFDFRDDGGFEARNPGVVVGIDLSAERRAGVMTARDSITPIFCVKEFEEVGVFRSGMSDYDANYAFCEVGQMQDLLKRQGFVNTLAVSVDDYEAHGAEARERIVEAIHAVRPCENPGAHIYGRCGLLQTKTWEQVKANLLMAVDVEKGIQIIVLFVIIIVAGFSIVAIYTLVVRAKSRDIGILRALGASERGVLSIFLMSGGLCGLFGCGIGIGLGLLMAYNVNEIEGFMRVVSREMNRMRIDSGHNWGQVGALLAAGIAVVWTWLVFYKERRPHPWIRMGGALAALLVAAYLCTSWADGYQHREHFDPELAPGFRLRFLLWVAFLWGSLVGAWRLLDRVRRRPAWIFFGAAGTIVLSAILLSIIATLSIAASIALTKPRPGWRGLEIFSRQIYYLDRIPVYVDYQALALYVVITLIVCVICSIYPALRAASANPVEVIRDE
jgi:lipoprotein-releasing system permease protein